MRPIVSILISLLFLFVYFSSLTGCTLGSRNRERFSNKLPNIILIVTDDQPPYTLDYMPILGQEIEERGIEFPNAYATTPLCAPSRASVLTGMYASEHQVTSNRPPLGGFESFNDTDTFAVLLQEQGYKTSFLGKYLNGYTTMEYIPPGWDDWHAFIKGTTPKRYYFDYEMNENGNLVEYGNKKSEYSTDILTNLAVDFIKDQRNEPFFITLNYYSPHQPRVPAPRHEDMYRTDEQVSARREPAFFEADISDKPEWLQIFEMVDSSNPKETNYIDNVHQRTLRSVTSIDEGLQKIIKTLERYDLETITYIFFISDNGETRGEHRIISGKNCPYEECIEIPFVILLPENQPVLTHLNENFVLNIDLAPTFLDLANIEIPTQISGNSLLPLLSNPSETWREEVLIEHWQDTENIEEGGLVVQIPGFEAIRTSTWKFVRYETGELELYDLLNDPYEMNNLASVPEYNSVVENLGKKLDDLIAEERN